MGIFLVGLIVGITAGILVDGAIVGGNVVGAGVGPAVVGAFVVVGEIVGAKEGTLLEFPPPELVDVTAKSLEEKKTIATIIMVNTFHLLGTVYPRCFEIPNILDESATRISGWANNVMKR